MITIRPDVSYLPATDDPLSADVVKISDAAFTLFYDVGSSAEAAEIIENTLGRRIVVLSHFHPDHIANLTRIHYDELYVGANTQKYTQKGTIIEIGKEFGANHKIRLYPFPSSHAKGSLAMELDERDLFLGDALYATRKAGKAVYNACLLLETIRLLKNSNAENIFLSHSNPFGKSKNQVLDELQLIYSKRKQNEPYISVDR